MSNDHKHDHGACCGAYDHEPPKESRVLNGIVMVSYFIELRREGDV